MSTAKRSHKGMHSRQNAVSYAKATAAYTLLWAVCAGVVLAIFAHYNRSFLWVEDGLYQHFVAFNYICDCVDDLFRGVVPSSIDFSLGLGHDKLLLMGTYDFADPISWLAALLPLPRLARYTVMCFAKLWLAGFSVIVFCRSIGERTCVSIACAALAYAFSGNVFIMCSNHPNFACWTYFLPFMLAGIEYLKRGHSPLPLTIAVALNAIANVYVLYVDVMLAIMYVVVFALCDIAQKRKAAVVKDAAATCLKVAAAFCAGFALAAVVLLPAAYAYLHNARVADATGARDNMAFYGLGFLRDAFTGFFGGRNTAGFNTYVSLVPFLFVPLVALFTMRGRHTNFKVFFAILLVLAFVPLFGSIMNGYSYRTNRWTFVLCFLASMSLVLAYPRLTRLSRRQAAGIAICAVAYAAVIVIANLFHVRAFTLASLACMIIAALCFGLFTSLKDTNVLRRSKIGVGAVVTALVLAGSIGQACLITLPFAGNYLREFYAMDEVEPNLFGDSATAAIGLADAFSRTDSADSFANREEFAHVHGTSLWWSLMPQDVADFYQGMELSTVKQNCHFKGLDGRPGLLALTSTEFFTQKNGKNAGLPAGFSPVEDAAGKAEVYRAETAVPLGYAHTRYLLAEDAHAMNGIERELALLGAASVDAPIDGMEQARPDDGRLAIADSRVSNSDNASYAKGALRFAGKGASLEISADTEPDCMVYLRLDAPVLSECAESSAVLDVTRTAEGDFEAHDMTWITKPTDRWHDQRKGIVFNLGCGGGGTSTIRIGCNRECEIDVGSIDVVSVPTSEYADGAAALAARPLENVSFERDGISGDIALDRTGLLQLSVPFNDGWSVSVDGQDAEAIRASEMFLAVKLEPGAHHVVFSYATPMLHMGALVSLLTCMALAVAALLGRSRRRRRRAR